MSPALELARHHLAERREEMAAALAAGLGGNGVYQADLQEELAYAQQAYVAAAVTEIASFRAQLGGPQLG
jgi:hypothetical protein